MCVAISYLFNALLIFIIWLKKHTHYSEKAVLQDKNALLEVGIKNHEQTIRSLHMKVKFRETALEKLKKTTEAKKSPGTVVDGKLWGSSSF